MAGSNFGGRLSKLVAVRTMKPTNTTHPTLARRTQRMLETQPTFLNLTDAAAGKLREITAEETNPDVGSAGLRLQRRLLRLQVRDDDRGRPDRGGPDPPGERGHGLRRRQERRPAPGRPDRLRRHAHGRRLHRQQPERGQPPAAAARASGPPTTPAAPGAARTRPTSLARARSRRSDPAASRFPAEVGPAIRRAAV